jgi:ABC-type polysaccharide/polyol phosphate export permease
MKIAKNVLGRIWSNRQALWMMIERDFKSRYVGSAAGLVWSVLHPLLMVGVYSLIFSLVFGRKIDDTPFSLWLFCALLPWIMFSEILRGSTGIIEKYKNLVTKTPFHSEILPIVVIGASTTGHLIGAGVLLSLLVIFHQPIGLFALTLPFYLVCLIFFSLGLSWLLSSLNVFVRDTSQIIGVVLQLWFYLCPIIYPTTIIPERYQFLLKLNPACFIVEGYRRALLYNQGIPLIDFAIFVGYCIFFLFFGGWVFRRLKSQFAEVL